MCSPATCQRCGSVTWTGCGEHVDEVMAHVPADRRCTCPRDGDEQPRSTGLRRLLGR